MFVCSEVEAGEPSVPRGAPAVAPPPHPAAPRLLPVALRGWEQQLLPHQQLCPLVQRHAALPRAAAHMRGGAGVGVCRFKPFFFIPAKHFVFLKFLKVLMYKSCKLLNKVWGFEEFNAVKWTVFALSGDFNRKIMYPFKIK